MLNRHAGSEQLCERFILSAGNKDRVGTENKGSLLIVMLLNRAEDFIAQAQIDGQAVRGLPVVLSETGVDLPAIVDVMQAGNPAAIGNAQQHSRERTASRPWRRGVIGEVVAEAKSTAGFGGLEDRELLYPHLGAKLQRVASPDPGQVVGKNKTVLFLNRRQVGGASDSSGAIAERDIRQATVVW